MPTTIDPRTGQPMRLPYPGDPGYQGPGGGGGGGVAYNPSQGMAGNPFQTGGIRRPNIGGPQPGGARRRRPGTAPPMGGGGMGKPMGRVAPPQMAMNQPAQVGTPMQDIGNFGAMGAIPGIGSPGAVNAGSVLNLPMSRRRGGFA
jgi:hypothetical protein